jgi:6-phosphogluconolactonase
MRGGTLTVWRGQWQIVASLLGWGIAAAAPAAEPLAVYLGTYTGGESRGIYLSTLDLDSGRLTEPRLVAETENPSFLALHPTGAWLYAVNEVQQFRDQPTGAVASYAVSDMTGDLTRLNQQPSGGAAPCHLIVDQTGRYVLVANYGAGSVAALRIEPDGSLGAQSALVQHRGSSVDPRRQEGPHAHSINLTLDNQFALAADLGLDAVLIYRFDAGPGALTAHGRAPMPAGAGPRHLALHPGGRFAYVINELQSTITVLVWDGQSGSLKTVQTISTLPEDFAGTNHTAEVQVSPDGRYVFGSNRGHDSLAVFAVDQQTGRLRFRQTQKTGGRTPRNFGVDPTGRYLLAANQGTGSVVAFRIAPRGDTVLQVTDHRIEAPSPVCVRFAARRQSRPPN